MKKFAILILPLLLCIGFMRLALNTDNSFLPSSGDLVDIFNAFPNVVDKIKNTVNEIKFQFENMTRDFKFASWVYTPFDASSISDFFESIGRFFNETFKNFGNVFNGLFNGLKTYFVSTWEILVLITKVLFIPIEIIIWFFQYILG